MKPAPLDDSGRLNGHAPTAHNGFLLFVPGDLIADGIATLPLPAESESHRPERTADITVPELGGLVRLAYTLKLYRHHKSSRWAWQVFRADAIQP